MVMKRKTSAFIMPAIVFCFFLAACGKVNTSNYNSITESIQATSNSGSTESSVTASESSETSNETSTGTSVSAGSETSTGTSISTSDSTSTETSASDTTSALEEPAVIAVKFYITNLCGVDIGMISTLDPVTKEQVDLGELPADKIMMLNFDWPKEVTTFDMAVYNVAGDLVSVSNIDITGVKESVMITLSGDHNLDSVNTTVE